jgi:hypothetical protein
MKNDILQIETQIMMKVSELNFLLNLARLYQSKMGVYTYGPNCIGINYSQW